MFSSYSSSAAIFHVVLGCHVTVIEKETRIPEVARCYFGICIHVLGLFCALRVEKRYISANVRKLWTTSLNRCTGKMHSKG